MLPKFLIDFLYPCRGSMPWNIIARYLLEMFQLVAASPSKSCYFHSFVFIVFSSLSFCNMLRSFSPKYQVLKLFCFYAGYSIFHLTSSHIYQVFFLSQLFSLVPFVFVHLSVSEILTVLTNTTSQKILIFFFTGTSRPLFNRPHRCLTVQEEDTRT
uniref:Predicted secreted protein n=1 Tax=Carukia barnesi TaxID=168717 RepID=D1FNZ0_CARBN|nr:predicted secreted protein [Carukia barnesi]